MKKLSALLLALSLTLTLAVCEAWAYPETGTASGAVSVPAADAVREAVRLVNAERADNGLYALEVDETMMKMAAKRAEELAEEVSNLRPNKTYFDSIFDEFDWPCSTCTENILVGSGSAARIVDKWMESRAANILRTDVTKIGIGYYYDADSTYKHHWVMLLATPKGDIEKGDPVKVADFLKAERKRIGLPCQIDPSLMVIASARAQELAQSYDQNRPDGSGYRTILGENGYSTYHSVQAIATGQKKVSGLLAHWLTLSEPSASILDRDITKIGVGYYYASGKHYWVMLGAA